jgi:hypothetical protein
MKLTIDDKKKEVHISEAEEWSIHYEMEDDVFVYPPNDLGSSTTHFADYPSTLTFGTDDGYVESSAH